MKYTTNDLSKLLNVSTNTIRRYEEKGLLHAFRNEKNGYREFDIVDVEKLMYTGKYRQAGFSQKEITEIFNENIQDRMDRFASKINELDKEIERLKSIRHLMKDDLKFLSSIENYEQEIFEYPSCGFYYLLYQVKGNVKLDEKRSTAMHHFLDTCTEYEYMYFFEKDAVINNRLEYSEGILTNEGLLKKINLNTSKPIEYYPARPCLMKTVKLPLNLRDETLMPRKEIIYNLFVQFNEHIAKNNFSIAGDMVGIKLGMSCEDGKDFQYLLIHLPIEKN